MTARYTQAVSLAPTTPSTALLTLFTLTHTTATTETPASTPVTVTGNLYLTPALVTAPVATIIGYNVHESRDCTVE